MYFSGFCLKNEKDLFKDYIIENNFTISGFSYGASLALEHTLRTSNRVDTLQLFSPSYFNDKDVKYKRMQMIYFKKDPNTYCDNFLKNCGISKKQKDKYFHIGATSQLEDLLYYDWSEDKLLEIVNKGINLEVYLGGKDKIINSKNTSEFFRKFADVYYIKEKGHTL